MRVIYAYESEHIECDGKEYPVVCLVEDQDGIRLLLNHGEFIRERHWLDAVQRGVQAIIRTDQLSYVSTENFAEEKLTSERDATVWFSAPVDSWAPCTELPDYITMEFRPPIPPEPKGFVHLHTHSEHSALDGVSTIEEIIDAALADGQEAIAVTDHGVCAGHPVLQLAAEKRGIKPIFGMEAYFVENRFARGAEHKNDYMHLVLWAMDDEGLRNLWAMSTESYREGLYYKPRLDWDTLRRLGGGVMASTACLRGPLLHPWSQGDNDRAYANLGKLQAIFGDRLYIELHVNHLEQQILGNRWLVDVARQYKVPLVAVVDSHYATKEDRDTHRVWLSIQTDSDIQDDTTLFAGGQDYHVMTQAEVREALSYLPADVVEDAVNNTAKVAARCTAAMTGKDYSPIYTRKLGATLEERVQLDVERLFDLCMQNWEKRTAGKNYSQEDALARFEREITLIIKKGFAGYFLMNWDIVSYAKENGVLVGPSRGSGGGSLVAYVLGITEIDPVEHDLLFERFMTEGRVELPDFDIDYPSSKKQFMLDYVTQRWGADHIAIVGTHLRLKNKGCINDTARAMRSVLPESTFADLKQVSNLIDEAEAPTAGLGLSWEDLWAEHGEVLEPYRERYPELFAMATELRGRLKTYSKHAAGVIIDPDEKLTGELPLWCESDSQYMTTQFDKNVLEKLGYVKFDMLNIRNLDTIQGAVDLIHQKTGRWVSPYEWREEYQDPLVWDEISDGWTLGIFQIETTAGTRLTKKFRPKSIADLADVITLVRPGPTRSGLTKTYFARRAGEEEITYPDARMEELLGKTQGCMLYQEDILAVCMSIAGYGSDEADGVRKILGKKQVEKAAEAGRKFRMRSIQNNTEEEVASLLWEQMAEFAKYSFGKAHATAYAIIGFWTAWLKFHYPVQFLCAALSSVKQERIPDFVEEARRMGYKVLPPDVNESGIGFTAQQMSVRYGLMSVKGIGPGSAEAIINHQPYTSWEHFLETRGEKCNAGHIKTLARLGTFDSLVPNRRGLEAVMAEEEVAPAERCVHRGPLVLWPHPEADSGHVELPCVFDWGAEPVEYGRTGKPKKGKPPVKRCTKGCRHYQQRDLLDPLTVTPYTEEDIRRIEMEFLGVFLSSTPFDRLPVEDRESVATAMDVLTGPPGNYLVAVLLKSFRPKPGGDRHGRKMGWLTFTTERGELDCVVFSRQYDRYGSLFKPGVLAYATVNKDDRGQQLDLFEPLD